MHTVMNLDPRVAAAEEEIARWQWKKWWMALLTVVNAFTYMLNGGWLTAVIAIAAWLLVVAYSFAQESLDREIEGFYADGDL